MSHTIENDSGKREQARKLIDFAIDRDQIIILETELLENPSTQRIELLHNIRKQAMKNADTLRWLVRQL